MKIKEKLTAKIFLIKSIRIIVIVYLTMLIFLFIRQKDMLYYPDYPKPSSFYECSNFKENEKKEYKGTRFYERKWTNNNVVISYHWNATTACNEYYLKDILDKSWNNYIFVEYYWYSTLGKNKPNKEKILYDTLNIWEYLKTANYNKIYVIWRSIWTWPASYYAKNFKTDKLLLISPYSQLYKVAKEKYPIFPIKLMFTENYNSIEYLKNYKNELLVIHGNKDEIIPFYLWKELYIWVNTPNKRFVEIENWNHNDLFENKKADDEIVKFLK